MEGKKLKKLKRKERLQVMKEKSNILPAGKKGLSQNTKGGQTLKTSLHKGKEKIRNLKGSS